MILRSGIGHIKDKIVDMILKSGIGHIKSKLLIMQSNLFY